MIANATAAATEPMRMSRLLHVRELVGEHAAELVAVEHLEDARGDRDRGVIRAAPGGEGVGLRSRRHVDRGHRHARLAGELLDDGVDLGRLLRVTGLARAALIASLSLNQ